MTAILERDRIRQIGGFLATALGEGWGPDTSPFWKDATHATRIVGPDGATLFLRLGSENSNRRGRLIISGAYPEGSSALYGVEYHEITVDATKSPDVIARDINRRLLPSYLPELATVTARLQDQKTAEASRAEATRRLGALPGVSAFRQDTSKAYVDLRGVHGDVSVNHDGDSADVTLRRVPLDLVEAFLATLNREE
jgi:hypothetical protein